MSKNVDSHAGRVVHVHEHRVGCDGGGGALGHPLTYYTLTDGKAVCRYCGTTFILHADAAGAHH